MAKREERSPTEKEEEEKTTQYHYLRKNKDEFQKTDRKQKQNEKQKRTEEKGLYSHTNIRKEPVHVTRDIPGRRNS